MTRPADARVGVNTKAHMAAIPAMTCTMALAGRPIRCQLSAARTRPPGNPSRNDAMPIPPGLHSATASTPAPSMSSGRSVLGAAHGTAASVASVTAGAGADGSTIEAAPRIPAAGRRCVRDGDEPCASVTVDPSRLAGVGSGLRGRDAPNARALPGDEIGPGDGSRRRRPEEDQGKPEFLSQDRQGVLDTASARGCQRPIGGPTEEHALCPERTCDRDVESAPDAAIDPDLGPPGDRVN